MAEIGGSETMEELTSRGPAFRVSREHEFDFALQVAFPAPGYIAAQL